MAVEAPSPPTILFPDENTGGWQPVNVIVIHSAVMDLYCGAARDLSEWAQGGSGLSWHYSVDSCEEFQNVWDNTVAWHCGWNYGKIGIEMCETPSQDKSRWNTREHEDLLARTAALVRALCRYYDIPMRKLSTADLVAGKKGICGHDDIPRKYTSHWDPGAFPWGRFLGLVRGEDTGNEEAGMSKEEYAEAVWDHQIPINVESKNPKWTAHYTLRNLEADSDQTQKLVRNVLKLVGQQNDVTAEELAEALTPKLSGALLPLLSRVVEDVLGKDNKATAEAIVQELAFALANEESA